MKPYHPALVHQIKRQRGFNPKATKDSNGRLMIGYGHLLEETTINVDTAEVMLVNDIDRHDKRLERSIPWINKLDQVRRAVIVNMAYTLGVRIVKKLKRMWSAINRWDYDLAAEEIETSGHVKRVASKDLIRDWTFQMRTGEFVH